MRPDASIVPEQRYWRRRANMRVRKRRIARNALRICGLLLIQLVIAAILFFAGLRGFERLLDSRMFAIDSVDLGGTRRAARERILADLTTFEGRNLFHLDLAEVAAAVERDPWVMEASIKRVMPGTLRIRIEERRPCAIALLAHQPYLVDCIGHVMGPVGPALFEDLPVLTGLENLEGPARDVALRRAVSLLERLRDTSPRFLQAISEFDLAEPDRVTVQTVLPGPRLLLDPVAVERNVERYLDLRGEIAQQVGTTDYVDLRWRGRITVMPEND